MLGSRAIAGTFQKSVLDHSDASGITMREAMQTADLDPDKTRPISFGQAKKPLAGLIPGRNLFARLSEALNLELAWSGQPLWLHRP